MRSLVLCWTMMFALACHPVAVRADAPFGSGAGVNAVDPAGTSVVGVTGAGGALQPCTAECPAGTIELTDGAGDFGGWCLSTSAPAAVTVDVQDVDLAQGTAVVGLSKQFLYPPGNYGFTPILMDFVQVCPDDDTVDVIVILDETISNQTGVAWTRFQWLLFDGGEAWFDAAASAGFVAPQFANWTFTNFLDPPADSQAKQLIAENGVVPDGTAVAPGIDAGPLVIGVDLTGDDPVSFALKQRPTAGPNPPATGACCFTDLSCLELADAACAAAGGVYSGDDTTCNPNPCNVLQRPLLGESTRPLGASTETH